jgi:hypothetical protein
VALLICCCFISARNAEVPRGLTAFVHPAPGCPPSEPITDSITERKRPGIDQYDREAGWSAGMEVIF